MSLRHIRLAVALVIRAWETYKLARENAEIEAPAKVAADDDDGEKKAWNVSGHVDVSARVRGKSGMSEEFRKNRYILCRYAKMGIYTRFWQGLRAESVHHPGHIHSRDNFVAFLCSVVWHLPLVLHPGTCLGAFSHCFPVAKVNQIN